MSVAALQSSATQEVVHIDIGGKTFKTLRRTIQKYPDSLIAKVFKERSQYSDAKQPVFIDHNPASFEWILEIYRCDPQCPVHRAQLSF